MFYSIFKGDSSAWFRLLTAHNYTEFDTSQFTMCLYFVFARFHFKI